MVLCLRRGGNSFLMRPSASILDFVGSRLSLNLFGCSVGFNFGYQPGSPPVRYFHCAKAGKKLDLIRANPIYARLIGSFEEINQRFDGKLGEVVAEMRKSFKIAA